MVAVVVIVDVLVELLYLYVNASAVTSNATVPTVGLARLQLQVDFWMAGVRESTTCSPPAIQLVEVWGTHPPFYFTPRPPLT